MSQVVHRPSRTRAGSAALIVASIALVACATTGPTGNPTPESVGISSERLERLDRALDAFVDEDRLPGYQLLVARRGQVVHERLYGLRDLEAKQPVERDTLFRIYSMSKVITGAATLIAMEQGLFLLGEPVSKYLPVLADLEVMVWEEDGTTRIVPAEREITILDLLRHTSGLTYSFIGPPPIGERYVDASITPGIRGLPDDAGLGPAGEDLDADLGDMVERLGEIPLIAQPGSAWHYGVNMDVLGALIEVTSGMSFPQFLQQNLFGPLGMEDTAFYVSADRVERFAACYGPSPEGGMRLLDAPVESDYLEPPAMPGGGGGLVSTAPDYMRFALMLENDGELDGVRVLGRKSIDLMMANHMPEQDFGLRPLGPMAQRLFANGGLGVGFGLTGSVFTEPAWTTLPVSKGTFSWGGAANTFFFVDREEELALVFMTQLVPSGVVPVRPILFTLGFQAIAD